MAPHSSSGYAAGTLGMAALLTVLTSSQGLLTTASKRDGSYEYNFATATDPKAARCTTQLKTVALFLVPSLIYMLHNNVQFYFLKYVDPATYQILGNLKIITTGVLFRVFLRRQLSLLQWIALFLLAVGATTSQINTDCSSAAKSLMSAPLAGYLFGALSATLSAVAAVYTEWVMKHNTDSLYWQNMQLYFFGVIFNGAALLLGGGGDGWSLLDFFNGYNGMTWLVVGNLAFSGLLVSWVMKFADSIVKVYATSLAMLLTTGISITFFGLQPTLQLALGLIVASTSVVLYYVSPEKLALPPAIGAPPAAHEAAGKGALLPK
ncbi:hypothetical protein QBZ16_002136 [Prototheca wickerhamii]|uniref:Uncharacterized protein n=1 Tax=Prototheca wickerhamii TaxID=3111 RepID=A0AAD9MNW4_PROWI|nr:hypothetical protein QBZ16_002136 [Prototheca wickerhamii]